MPVRAVTDVLAVEDEDVERDEGHVSGCAVGAQTAAEPVEVVRPARVGDELAIENEGTCRRRRALGGAGTFVVMSRPVRVLP